MINEFLTVEEFDSAYDCIKRVIHRTPVLRASLLGREAGVDLYIKCENLQKTGSFKVRGDLYKTLQLSPDAKSRGVVTVSAGNHAQALAWASQTAAKKARYGFSASAVSG